VKTMLENSKGNMKRRIICVMDVAAGRARWWESVCSTMR
jgi:hypothetical protein